MFINLHLHSTFSLRDSTTYPDEFISKVAESGANAIAFTEHGNVFAHIKKHNLCKEYGIKYIHGVEMYMTRTLDEKIRDNYHVILLAKNPQGVKEINRLCTMATDEKHTFYRPRISFEEFTQLSENIITSSACLGGVFADIDENDEWFDRLMNRMDYLEIQPHLMARQIEYNKTLLQYKLKYDKPFLLTNDVHELDAYRLECRNTWIKGVRDAEYDDVEDFDLTLKTEEELIELCKKQNCFDFKYYLEGIENSVKIADSIIEDEIDKSFKYPDIYDNADEMLRENVYESYAKKYDLGAVVREKEDKYFEMMEEEIRVFQKLGMSSFILYMSEQSRWEIDNSIDVGYGRGSCCGSLVCYLLDITDVDPVVWGTIFSRFCNEDRISLGDIDKDYCPKDRTTVFNHIKDRFGAEFTSFIGTFQKLKTKSIIDAVGRAIGLDKQEVVDIKKGYEVIEQERDRIQSAYDDGKITKNEYKESMEINDKETDKYISKFDNIFYYYNGLKKAVNATGFHPSGFIGSPINIVDSIGLRYNKSIQGWISMCDMKEVDGCNYVKYDILSSKTTQVVSETFKLAGVEKPRSYKINWNDERVFEDMLRSPVGLFQFESDSAFSYLQQFEPKSVQDICLLSAVLRPSCASFRDKVFAREVHENPSEVIAEVLKDSYGFLVYQEQQIAFLQKACGFTGGQADTIRRAIGKKDEVLLKKWLPVIKEGYIKNSTKDKATAEKEVEEFMTIFIDSASYSFGKNHSIAYSMLTYMTAYVRLYYPVEFITTYLNNATNDDDIINGTALASLYNIKIENPQFGKSKGKYSISDGIIYKGIGSVLNISNKCGDDLYELAHSNILPEHCSFLDFIVLAKQNNYDLNKTQLQTLIKIDYFKSFGKILTLLKVYDIYSSYYSRKILDKNNIKKFLEGICIDMIKNNVEGFAEQKSRFKIDGAKLCDKLVSMLPQKDASVRDRIIYQLSYLNYLQDVDLLDFNIGLVKYISTKNNSVCIESVVDKKTSWYGCGQYSFKKEDIVYIKTSSFVKNGRRRERIILDCEILELDRNKQKSKGD